MVESAKPQYKLIEAEVSAPGKLIISGEHAVVYGHPVLAIAVSKRVKARFTVLRSDAEEPSLKVTIFNTQRSSEMVLHLPAAEGEKSHEMQLLDHIYRDLAQLLTCQVTCRITFDSEIPIGSGMGSSAAYAAALSTAFVFAVLAAAGQLQTDAGSASQKGSRTDTSTMSMTGMKDLTTGPFG